MHFFHFFQKFFDPLLKEWTPFTPSLPFWIASHVMHSELYNRLILKDRDKLKRSMSHIKFHVNRKRQNNNESIYRIAIQLLFVDTDASV